MTLLWVWGSEPERSPTSTYSPTQSASSNLASEPGMERMGTSDIEGSEPDWRTYEVAATECGQRRRFKAGMQEPSGGDDAR